MDEPDFRYEQEDRPNRVAPTRSPRVTFALAALGITGIAVAVLVFFYLRSATRRSSPAPAAPPVAAEPLLEASASSPAPPPPAPPPPLDGSDAAVRGRLAALSGAPEWTAWLAADDLVRRAVSAVARVGEGKSPLAAFDHLRLDGSFAVSARDGRLTIDPASYNRYDRPTSVLAALDVGAAAEAWRWLRPLAEAAWREIAPPHETLDAGVARALDHLLATPQPREPVEVRLEDGLYRFVDPVLEALTPAQKHLVRAGPENGERLRSLAAALRARLVPPG